MWRRGRGGAAHISRGKSRTKRKEGCEKTEGRGGSFGRRQGVGGGYCSGGWLVCLGVSTRRDHAYRLHEVSHVTIKKTLRAWCARATPGTKNVPNGYSSSTRGACVEYGAISIAHRVGFSEWGEA